MSKRPVPTVLSAWDVLFIAVGQIIGAGVIALTGIAIGLTGPAVIFACLAVAVLVLIVTLLIMMAGTVLRATGAYNVWTSRLGGGWLRSIELLLILLASVSLSLYGSSLGLYLNPPFPVLSANSWGVVVIATLIVWTVVTLAYYPLRRSFLGRRGFDLDAATMDRGVFDASKA